MRIFNYPTNSIFDEIDIYLTPNEIKEMINKMSNLLEDSKLHHIHLSEYNQDSSKIIKEINVCVYTNNNLSEFDERSRKIILEDK